MSSTNNNHVLSRDHLISIALAAITFLMSYPHATGGLDPLHDGAVLKPALDVLSGQALFRDSYFPYGPLTTYLQAGWLWMFGASVKALKLCTVFTYSIISVLIFQLWRKILPVGLALAAVSLWIILFPCFSRNHFQLTPWSSVFSLLFQLLSIYFFVVWTERSEKRFLLLCGAATSLTFYCRQPVGMTLLICYFAGLAIFPWIRRSVPEFKAILSYGAGVIAGAIPFLWVTVSQGATRDWYLQNLVWPSQWASFSGDEHSTGSGLWAIVKELWLPWTSPATNIRPAPADWLPYFAVVFLALLVPISLARLGRHWNKKWVLLYYGTLASSMVALCVMSGEWRYKLEAMFRVGFVASVPLILLVIFLVQLFRLRNPAPQRVSPAHMVFVMTLISLGSFAQFYPVPSVNHSFWAITPALGPVVYYLWVLTSKVQWLSLAAMGWWLMPVGAVQFSRWVSDVTHPFERLETNSVLRGTYIAASAIPTPHDWKTVLNIVDPYFKQNPDSKALLAGVDALYLTLAPNLANPGPFYQVQPMAIDESQMQKRKQFVETDRPIIFIQDGYSNYVGTDLRKLKFEELVFIPNMNLRIWAPAEKLSINQKQALSPTTKFVAEIDQ